MRLASILGIFDLRLWPVNLASRYISSHPATVTILLRPACPVLNHSNAAKAAVCADSAPVPAGRRDGHSLSVMVAAVHVQPLPLPLPLAHLQSLVL